jgi:hypothetical protein
MINKGVAQRSDLVGVPLADIKAMEIYLNRKFPVAYIQFLHLFGRSAGFLSGWAAVYFDDLKEIAEEFDLQKAMTDGNTDAFLPNDGLLIAHYNNSFDYLLCDGSADPQVFRITFAEDGAQCRRFSSSFSEYLETMIENAAEGKGRVEPFFIDECGNLLVDNLSSDVPAVD